MVFAFPEPKSWTRRATSSAHAASASSSTSSSRLSIREPAIAALAYLHQLIDSLEIIGMVRNRMERIRNTNVVVCLVRSFSDHDVRNNTGQVRLIRESGQI